MFLFVEETFGDKEPEFLGESEVWIEKVKMGARSEVLNMDSRNFRARGDSST